MSFADGVHHPVLFYAVPGIEGALECPVTCSRGGRQDFDDQVRCTLYVLGSDDVVALIGDEKQVGLHHVRIRQHYVKGSVIDPPRIVFRCELNQSPP